MGKKNDNKQFAGQIVVVTGASAGIGRATSEAFAREGARLVLISRNVARLNQVKLEAENLGSPRVLIFSVDVSDAKKIEETVMKIEKEMGPIDIWVNNAMVSVFSPVKDMTPKDYKRVTEVTYLGYVYSTLAVLKRMLPRDRGTIILIGSALAYRGIPLQSAYCAAKHAVQGFNDSLQSELIHDKSNVKVTMLQFPAFNTPQFDWVKSRMKNKAQPVPPIYQPEVATRAIMFAITHPKREWIIGFPSLGAIWGNRFFPAFVDRYLAKNGYDSQTTDKPEKPDRPNNVFKTVDGDYSAHGRFDSQAKSWNLHLWWLMNRKWLIIIFLLMVFMPIVIWQM